MFRSAFGVFICLAAMAAPATAVLPIYDVTGDGTWDCREPNGTYAGAVVLAEKTYAFIKPDGRVGGYGQVYIITEGLHLPLYAMVSGYMKDKLGSKGFGLRGPKKNPHDLLGELYLNVIFSESGDGELDWDCMRRKAPGA